MSSFCWRISSCFKSSLFTTIWHSGQSLYSFSKYLSKAVTSVSKLAYVNQIDKLYYLEQFKPGLHAIKVQVHLAFIWSTKTVKNITYKIIFQFYKGIYTKNINKLDIIYFYLISTIYNWFRELCYCYFKQENHFSKQRFFMCFTRKMTNSLI